MTGAFTAPVVLAFLTGTLVWTAGCVKPRDSAALPELAGTVCGVGGYGISPQLASVMAVIMSAAFVAGVGVAAADILLVRRMRPPAAVAAEASLALTVLAAGCVSTVVVLLWLALSTGFGWMVDIAVASLIGGIVALGCRLVARGVARILERPGRSR